MNFFQKTTLSLAFLILSANSSLALNKPKGEVILSLTGAISETNGEGTADFDMEMLQELTQRETKTKTPWTEGETVFSGPVLEAVLKAAGSNGSKLIVKALNDYAAEVPIEDATNYPTILAISKDGKAMPVRDKGPLFMIYPFDTHPELYNEKYFNRSVWQIRSIEIIK